MAVSADGNNHIASFGYDASGNAQSEGSISYSWNAESEMKAAAGVTYGYDGDGRRVYKSSGKLYWYGAGGDILAETDASGNTLAEYVFFGGKRLAMLPAGGNSIYYVEDMLGTSRVITQNNGAVCYDADFDPFGGEHAYSNSCPQNYKFEGKERDGETGNDDFGARTYSNRFGRWLSADWSAVPVAVPYASLSNPQTLNLYAMVADDPETFADLDGHTFTQTYQLANTGGSFWDPGSADGMSDQSGLTQGTHTTESYTYDPVGNRLSSLGVSPYNINVSNELTSTPSAGYAYDHNGNLLTKVVGSNTTSYAWDFENRLSSVTLPGTGGTVSFKYDSFGRRIQKSFTTGSNPPTTTTTNYLYDGHNNIEEVDQNGNVLSRYAQGLNIDEPLAELRSGTASYYQADGLSSVTSLSNAAGAIANTYTYDGFGKQTASTGTVANPFQYTGREFDTETNLYDYRARYYEPTIGRFLSEDEIGNDERVNLYLYVRNSPVDSRDPTGFYTLKGFLPGDAQKMSKAINSAISTVGKSCDGCAGPWGPKIVQALQSATFVFVADLRTPIGHFPECATASPLNTKTIRVGSGAFNPIKCGCLQSTLAHEAMHKAQNSADEHLGGFGPVEMEKACFPGCQ